MGRSEKTAEWTESYQMQQKAVFLAACCFFVVMLRSYVGMAVTFPWKTGALSFVAVLAVVCGKIAGGFCAARYGPLKTVTITLMLSAFCYLYPAAVPAGVCALFFFQMTMPVTLYLMIRRFSSMPGFSFGCLTFALFLGFLPGYFDWKASVGGNVIGCVGSLLSLLVLASYLYIERNRI